MNARPTIVRSTLTKSRRGKSDWKRVEALGDREIRRTLRTDPDAAPVATPTWLRRAKIVLPQPKQAVSIRLDRDVVEWFKQRGPRYQTRINAVLRAYVEASR